MLTRLLTVIVFVLAIVTAILGTKMMSDEKPTETSALNPEEVQKIVATYLTENPNVIVEAFTEAQKRQAEKEEEEAKKAISTSRTDLENDAATPYVGRPDASVVIVKFSDYNCGYCKHVLPDIQKILSENTNVKFVMKDFPILGERSVENSKAAIAAFRLAPEKWFNFHAALLKTTPRNDEQLLALATENGYNSDLLKAEMAKPEVMQQIEKNMTLGQRVGVRGTPAFVINGELVRGAIGYDQFKTIIDALGTNKS